MNSVTFIIGQLIIGGAEKQLFLTVKGLMERGWKINVINLHGNNNDYWEGPLRELGVKICEIETSSKIKAISKMVSFVNENPTLIIHSWSTFTGPYAIIVSYFTRTKICVGSQRSTEKNTIKDLGFILYYLCYIGFKGITVNSKFGMKELQRRWPNKKICYIPNAISYQAIEKNLKSLNVSGLREKYNIPDKLILVGSAGLIINTKRFDLLIEAMKIVQNNVNNCGLIIFGDGLLKETLFSKAKKELKKDTYFFPGFVSNAEYSLPLIDIFCLTSEYEGTPNVLMEALASGLPVISTNVGDVSELITNEKIGFITPSNDPIIISQKIIKIINNYSYYLQFSNDRKNIIKNKFDTNITIGNIIKFYDSMKINKRRFTD